MAKPPSKQSRLALRLKRLQLQIALDPTSEHVPSPYARHHILSGKAHEPTTITIGPLAITTWPKERNHAALRFAPDDEIQGSMLHNYRASSWDRTFQAWRIRGTAAKTTIIPWATELIAHLSASRSDFDARKAISGNAHLLDRPGVSFPPHDTIVQFAYEHSSEKFHAEMPNVKFNKSEKAWTWAVRRPGDIEAIIAGIDKITAHIIAEAPVAAERRTRMAALVALHAAIAAVPGVKRITFVYASGTAFDYLMLPDGTLPTDQSFYQKSLLWAINDATAKIFIEQFATTDTRSGPAAFYGILIARGIPMPIPAQALRHDKFVANPDLCRDLISL